MRSLLLSIGACILVLDATWAQNTGEGGNMPQLPVGQTFKQFEFPVYEDGKLKYTGTASEAKGITVNRAEATDLKIDVYDNGAVSSTITSPKADLYLSEQRMQTKNTVRVERTDMDATSQNCDFDLKNKKFLLRTNVKVILKHFDLTMSPPPGGSAPVPVSTGTPSSIAPVPSSNPETK